MCVLSITKCAISRYRIYECATDRNIIERHVIGSYIFCKRMCSRYIYTVLKSMYVIDEYVDHG